MKGMRVYVAGPYTKPDPCINTNKAIQLGQALLEKGYVPFIPHLTHFWHTVIPNPYQVWLDPDIEWLGCCHVMLRFEGESSGADKEEAFANRLDIPVVRSLQELEERFPV